MTVHDFNSLPEKQLKETLLNCCGSRAWVKRMMPLFPFEDMIELIESAEEQWFMCNTDDWKEAFASHPRIGDIDSLEKKFESTVEWAAEEQSGASNASHHTLKALAEGNKKYEQKFGYIFIVFASGKSAEEMLGILTTRLRNEPLTELNIAAEEQNKITRHRIQKLFL